MITITLTETQLETAIDALRDREEQTLDHLNSDPTLPQDDRTLLEIAAEDYGGLAGLLEDHRA